MTDFRPLLWPTLFTVPVLLMCLALGSWQIERLFWKEDLIAQRQAAVAAAPAAVPQSLAEARGMEFRHVSDEGVFLQRQGNLSRRDIGGRRAGLPGADPAAGAGRPRRLCQSRVHSRAS